MTSCTLNEHSEDETEENIKQFHELELDDRILKVCKYFLTLYGCLFYEANFS
jgi:hypothetical protein